VETAFKQASRPIGAAGVLGISAILKLGFKGVRQKRVQRSSFWIVLASEKSIMGSNFQSSINFINIGAKSSKFLGNSVYCWRSLKPAVQVLLII
jgi:hypothetical protein